MFGGPISADEQFVRLATPRLTPRHHLFSGAHMGSLNWLRSAPLIYWVLSGQLTAAPQKQPQTLDQVIQETLAQNLRLMADRYDLAIADARMLQARLRPNPVLSLQGNYLDALGAGFSFEKNPAGPPEFDAGLNFLIEQPGKRKARVRVAAAAKDVLEADFLNKTRILIVEVQNAFVDMELAKANLALQRENAAYFEALIELNRVRVKAGDLAVVELTRSELAGLQYQNQLRQAEVRLQSARVHIQEVMGRSLFDPAFDITGDLRNDELTLSLAELRSRALQARPDLVALHRDVDRATAEMRLQRHQNVGDTAFQFLVNRQWDIGIRRGQSLSLVLLQPLPLLNRNQGEIERANEEFLQSRARVRAAEADVLAELENTFEQYLVARQTVDSIRSGMLDRARRVRETMEYSYRRGEASLVEFLDAQRAFNDTMQNYNDARADYARSLNLVEAAAGQTRRP
jgi:cobalt-zinc-cadmium efflux system outer membrane protein